MAPTTRGFAYPLRIDSGERVFERRSGRRILEDADGRKIRMVTDEESIEQQIRSVLETRPFERVYRQDYGFDPRIFDLLEPNAINARIMQAVEKNVPLVENLRIVSTATPESMEDGLYSIVLYYDIKGKGSATPLPLHISQSQ